MTFQAVYWFSQRQSLCRATLFISAARVIPNWKQILSNLWLMLNFAPAPVDLFARSPAVGTQSNNSATASLSTFRTWQLREHYWSKLRSIQGKVWRGMFSCTWSLSNCSQICTHDGNCSTNLFNYKEFFLLSEHTSCFGRVVLHSQRLSSTSEYLLKWELSLS